MVVSNYIQEKDLLWFEGALFEVDANPGGSSELHAWRNIPGGVDGEHATENVDLSPSEALYVPYINNRLLAFNECKRIWDMILLLGMITHSRPALYTQTMMLTGICYIEDLIEQSFFGVDLSVKDPYPWEGTDFQILADLPTSKALREEYSWALPNEVGSLHKLNNVIHYAFHRGYMARSLGSERRPDTLEVL